MIKDAEYWRKLLTEAEAWMNDPTGMRNRMLSRVITDDPYEQMDVEMAATYEYASAMAWLRGEEAIIIAPNHICIHCTSTKDFWSDEGEQVPIASPTLWFGPKIGWCCGICGNPTDACFPSPNIEPKHHARPQ
jgi:hypothetical protein